MTKERLTLIGAAFIAITATVLTIILWHNSKIVHASTEGQDNNETTYSTTNSLPTMSVEEMQDKIEKNNLAKASSLVYAFIPLSDDMQEYCYLTAHKYELNVMLVYAVMFHASSFNADAYAKFDNSECFGLMQISSAHQSELEELGLYDYRTNPYSNIEAGCYLLQKCRVATPAGIGHSFTYMLMAYNEGISKANNNYSSGIFETEYTKNVTNKMNEYIACSLRN